jgi:hypothetical protein
MGFLGFIWLLQSARGIVHGAEPLIWLREIHMQIVIPFKALYAARASSLLPKNMLWNGRSHKALNRWIRKVILDDTFSILLRTRLVSIAALLKRYSPLPYPLLKLLSHIPALPSNS